MRLCPEILFLIFTLFLKIGVCQDANNENILLKEYISELSSEAYHGRYAGTEYEKLSAKYISTQLAKLEIDSYFDDSYFQYFDFKIDSVNYQSQNVIAYIDNNSDSTILLISHYDHIGLGGPLSKSFFENDVHPGADDNASGVAANIILALRFSQSDYKTYNLIFLFTGAHEVGLFGVEYFFKNSILNNITLVINLDMIGRLDRTTSTLLYESNSPLLNQDYLQSISNNKLKFLPKDNLKGDHSIFIENNIPVLFLSAGIHDDYHKISDTEDKINYSGLLSIIDFVETILKLHL